MGNLQDDIVKYKKGELGPKEMHALERKALSDPFLAEALEGLENISSEDLHKDVEELNRRILKEKKTILFTPLRVAAGVILVSASIFILYQLVPKQEIVALKTEKPVATPSASPKEEPKKQEEKKDLNANKETKPSSVVGEQLKSEKKKTPSAKVVEKEKAVTDKVVKEAKPKIETQPLIAKTETTGPEKKTEEVKVAPQEKEEVAMVTEPAKEITQQDLKSDRMVGRASKKTNDKSEALSGAGLPGKESIVSKPISGKVISAEDGSALPGVNVVIEGTTIGTVTDADGKFTLKNTSENQRLVFSFIGLQTQEVSVEGKDKVDVELKTDVTQLSEVVVTGLGYSKDNDEEPVIHLAEPQGGVRAYNKYLDANVRYPEEALKVKIKGKVKVEFIVRTDGSLDEYNVVKSLGHGCDEEVIRLIKAGPKWSPSTENGKPVESTVRVGVKFDPAKSGK
jgi:TonB family protein